MIVSMARIQEYVSKIDFDAFKKSYITVDAVIRNFEIIGEAVKNLPQKLKSDHPEIPWNEMYRLRNRVSHEYFGVNYEIIWDIAVNYLPANISDIRKILEEERNRQ